ncbi:alpha-(1-_3)-arabinofuranosyltransferase domain-containing protein, partial [Nostocoides australiense]|uniref:alpha-(1->3)-arabinofuranosyltransferase domain-containing protein n=1 Tax=Nostocoides australiense TaxID=99480 RepID=UPI0012ED3551
MSTDITGTRVAPVEIYAVTGRAAPRASLWPVTSVPVVSGASEVLPALAESGLAQGPVRFDGDADPGETNPRIETDSFRARDRYFGATRGQDVTRTLTAGESDASTDYFPWPHGRLRSTITYGGGIAGVSASTALGDQLTLAGLAPARRPYAALDGDPATAWLTFGDSAPTLAVTFPAERTVHTVRVRPAADPDLFGAGISSPTSVRISLGGKSIDTEIGASAPVSLPAGMSGRELEVRILDTVDGAPGAVLTGLAEVGIDDLAPTETVRLPQPVTRGVTQGFVLSRDSDAADGCIRTAAGFQCLGGGYRPAEESGTLRREVTTTADGSYAVSGRLVADPAHPSSALAIPGVREITASSTRTLGLPGAP